MSQGELSAEGGFFGDVVGHGRPLRVLRRVLARGRVAHAYLFWGAAGIGKARVARAVAAALLCARADGEGLPCGSCPSCAKVASGAHPDLHWLQREGASLPIAAIRALQETLSYQAFERGRKVAIIPDASRMTREASNALLKTLEEPPAGTHLLLLTQHRNQLLPTLVSRCQSLRFDPLAEDEVRRLLEARGDPPEVAAALAKMAGGSPGSVWGEAAQTLLAADQEVAELWARWPRLQIGERFQAAAAWAAERDALERRLDALERHLWGDLRGAARAGSADPWVLDLLGALQRTRQLLERNVNPQLALDALFLGLGEPGREDYC